MVKNSNGDDVPRILIENTPIKMDYKFLNVPTYSVLNNPSAPKGVKFLGIQGKHLYSKVNIFVIAWSPFLMYVFVFAATSSFDNILTDEKYYDLTPS